MTQETYKGIPRNKIPWYPTIDYKKCISCGKCVEYCKFGVFCSKETSDKKQVEIIKPYNCIVLCKGCQDICPSEAISHPSRKDTANLIRILKKFNSIKESQKY